MTDGFVMVPVEAIDSEICEDCQELEIEDVLITPDERGYRCAHLDTCRAVMARLRKGKKEEAEA